jgi:hypothetical protein
MVVMQPKCTVEGADIVMQSPGFGGIDVGNYLSQAATIHGLLGGIASRAWIKGRVGVPDFDRGKKDPRVQREKSPPGEYFSLAFFCWILGGEKTSQLGRASVRCESKTEQPRKVPNACDATGEHRPVG